METEAPKRTINTIRRDFNDNIRGITQEDIDNAAKHSKDSCALALALKRDLKVHRVEVSKAGIYIEIEDGSPLEYVFSIGDKFIEWVEAFDRGEKVEPFPIVKMPEFFCGGGG